MFDKSKLMNFFNSTKKKDAKVLDSYDKKMIMSNIKLEYILDISSALYDCQLAAKVSHASSVSNNYEKAKGFVDKIMGYGHDSISAHSNIQFFISFSGAFNIPSDQLIDAMPGLKYFNIAEIPVENYEGKRYLLIGATIRALRYFIIKTSRVLNHNYKLDGTAMVDTSDNEFINVIKGIIYSTTEKIFFKDLIEVGALDGTMFTYCSEIDNADEFIDKQYEEEKDAAEDIADLNLKVPTAIKTGNVTLIDSCTSLTRSLSMISDIIPNAAIFDVIEALIKTSFVMIKIEDFSRAISTQINRHEAGITQESQRFVDYSKAKFIDPLPFNKSQYPDSEKVYHVSVQSTTFDVTSAQLGDMLVKIYPQLIEQGMLKQDARSYLPMNVETKGYYTFSMENYIHFLEVRLDKAAQPEVRQIALNMYKVLYKHILSMNLNNDILNNIILLPVNKLLTEEELKECQETLTI